MAVSGEADGAVEEYGRQLGGIAGGCLERTELGRRIGRVAGTLGGVALMTVQHRDQL